MSEKTPEKNEQSESAQSLLAWYQMPYGQDMRQKVSECVKGLLRKKPVSSVLQMNSMLYSDLLKDEKLSQVYQLGEEGTIQATLDETGYLPLTSRSIDCVMLMHELDITDNPHQILRESERVLSDSGYLIVVGFNQLSLYGLYKGLASLFEQKNTRWKFHNMNKIRDWLNLLNFDVEKSTSISYFFPVNHPIFKTRFRFFHYLAKRQGSAFGNIYVLVAKKRTVPITPVIFKWRKGGQLSSTRLNPSSFVAEKRVH